MIKNFISVHRNDDIRQLALQAKRYPDIDMTFAIQQIDGWQRARQKLPMWVECDDIIYPPHISMEQCSSEKTALYKQQLAKRLCGDSSSNIFYDLTGGFGVDFSYISRIFDKAIYIEQQQHLCDIAQHNFKVLNINNSEVFCVNSTDYLSRIVKKNDITTTIYLDPARRDINGKKTYAISDCTPDVVTLLPLLKQKADIIIIKLSPMLDHHEALRQLPGITEIHIISVNNECKEILLIINQRQTKEQEKQADSSEKSSRDPVLLFCANNNDIFTTTISLSATMPKASAFDFKGNTLDLIGNTLYIPNASIMKAGCFYALCQRFSLCALDNNSHLFISSNNDIKQFPGRSFTITAITSMNKKELKASLAGINKANIAVRNFPLSTDALRKKLSLKDGGDVYIFATTIAKNHLLIICKKAT